LSQPRAHPSGKRLDYAGPDDIRQYQVHLLEERKLAVRTVVQHVAAVRFLYCKTLKRHDMKEDLPYPRNYRRTRPSFSARGSGPAHRLGTKPLSSGMLMTLCSCGLRRIELCRLKVSDIDGQRMVLRVEHGNAAWTATFRSARN